MGDGVMDVMNKITWHRNNQLVPKDAQKAHLFQKRCRPANVIEKGDC